MEEIFRQSRPVLIFTFVVLACVVAPGIVAAKMFYPELIQPGIKGHVFSGLVAASPPVILAFVIISISGHAKYGSGNTARFMTEFTFAGFTCFLSYFSAAALAHFQGLSFGWFVGVTALIWILVLWFFMVIPRA